MNLNLQALFPADLEKRLFFLVILFLPTQLGKHFWPNFSYIYSLKIDYLSPTLYFWDILVLLLGVVWIVNGFRLNKLAMSLVLTFLLTQSLSLLGASNTGAGLVRLWQFFITCFLGVYVASLDWQFIKKPFLKGLVLGVIFESLLAVGQFIFGGDLGFWIFGERHFSLATPTIATFNFYGQVFLRPYGTTSHPNILAAYFVLCILLFAILAKKSFLNYLVITISLTACLLTFSRSAILVLVTESVLIFKSRIKFLVLLALITLPFLYVRFDSAFNFDSLSIIRREELAQFGFDQFLVNPFIGVGLNNSINVMASSDLVSGPNRFLQPIHNIFLLSLVETGILGLSGFLITFLFPFWKLIKRKSSVALLFPVIIFLGFFDHYFLTLPQGQRMLFLIWGVSMLELKSGSYKKDF